MQRSRFPVLSASTLMGDPVRNRKNEDLGNIKEFMIDTSNGQVVYAVLSFGGFFGMGDKLFAIPWEALDLDEETHSFVLDVDQDMLEDAPGFDKDNWPEEPNREFINRVHTHYGYDPYYEESGRVRQRTGRGPERERERTGTTGTMGSTSETGRTGTAGPSGTETATP